MTDERCPGAVRKGKLAPSCLAPLHSIRQKKSQTCLLCTHSLTPTLGNRKGSHLDGTFLLPLYCLHILHLGGEEARAESSPLRFLRWQYH